MTTGHRNVEIEDRLVEKNQIPSWSHLHSSNIQLLS